MHTIEQHGMDRAEREAVLAEAEAYAATLATDGGADEHTIEGDAVRFSSIATGARGPTRFMSTAFGSAPIRVPLLNQHKSDEVLGVAELVPGGDGLRVRARLSNTAAARDALQLVRDGALSGFSIGFDTLTSKHEGGVRVVSGARVHEVSLVTFPADAAARVQSAGGKATPRHLHAADPHERERSDAPPSDRAAIVNDAIGWCEDHNIRLDPLELEDEAAPVRPGFTWLGQPDTPAARWTREESARADERNAAAVREWNAATRPPRHGAW